MTTASCYNEMSTFQCRMLTFQGDAMYEFYDDHMSKCSKEISTRKPNIDMSTCREHTVNDSAPAICMLLHSSWFDRLVSSSQLDRHHLRLANHHLLLLLLMLSSHPPSHDLLSSRSPPNKSLGVKLFWIPNFLPLLTAAGLRVGAPHWGGPWLTSWGPNRLAGPGPGPSPCLGGGDADNWACALDWSHWGPNHPVVGGSMLGNSCRPTSNLTSRPCGQTLAKVKRWKQWWSVLYFMNTLLDRDGYVGIRYRLVDS